MKFWKFASFALAASLAGGVAHAAMAPDILVESSTNGSAAPGGTAFTSFTIGFAGNYEFIGMGMTMSYDPSLLTFNPVQSSVAILGNSYTLPDFIALLSGLQAAPGSDFEAFGGEDSPGNLFFGAGYTVSGSTTLNGQIVVTTAFDLAPSFLGGQTPVTIAQLDFADINTGFTALASAENPLVMTVTAVPEPESWLMLLAGVGLLGAVAKRRTRRA